jgi:PAS domain S-box-containing protein
MNKKTSSAAGLDKLTIFFSPKRQIYLISFLVCILVVAGGYYYYRYEEKSIRSDKYEQLKAIATLKINQITQWQKERIGDANVLSQSFLFKKGFEQFLAGENNPGLKSDIINWFRTVKEQYGYENVFISNSDGKLFLSPDPDFKYFDSATSVYIKETVKNKKVLITDFYRLGIDKEIYLDIIAPILNDKSKPVAAVVLRVKPADYLYPLIQSLPIPSKTFETYIVRKDGDNILYLNELRHLKNSAMNLRIPLTRKDIPGVQAVLGYKGFFEGPDYRGVAVLTYINPVPGTPWFMVSKVERSEIFSEVQYIAVIIIVFVSMLILLSGAGLVWIYQYRQKNIYKELFLTEKNLREKEEEFRITLYSIGDAVITTGLNGLIKNMNHAAEKLTGWNESDAAGKKLEEVFQIINEESRLKVENPVEKVLREGLVVGLANHALLISRDGKETSIAESGAPIKNGMNEITGVVLVLRDQTPERETEKKLTQSEERFRLVFERSTMGISLMLPDGKLSKVNQAFAGMLGYTVDEIQKLNSPELTHPDDIDESMEGHRSLLTGEKSVFRMEKRYFHKDGSIVWIELSTTLQHDEKNNPLHFITSIQDITQRKRAEEEILKLNTELEQRVKERTVQLEEANKELEAFSYSVSHDLRAPLRAIEGFSRIFMEDYSCKLDDEGKRLINVVHNNTKKMDNLVTDLLELSRTGRTEMRIARVDMTAMAKSIYQEIASPEMVNTFKFSVSELPDAFADSTLMRQVWINIISNAIKYTLPKENRIIEIKGYKKENQNIYYVKDSGVGFNPAYTNKLFVVFQRLHKAEEFEGTGVGLAIVQRIIHRHGGEVWSEGEVNQGATFYFSLPNNKEEYYEQL